MKSRETQVILILCLFAVATFSIYGISIRTVFYIGALLAFFLIEHWFPIFPQQNVAKFNRWKVNLTFTFLLLFIATFPALLTSAMVYYEGWGLFHIARDLPTPLYLIISIVVLDFGLYLQHFLFHKTPVFWRLHRIHHTDLAFDVSLAGRFHPISGIFVALTRISIILLLGIEPLGFVMHLLLLAIFIQFVHSNIYLPMWLDKIIRMIFVTPRMHYVHHSTTVKETNSNYGVIFSFWDRIFGTYRESPAAGYDKMQLGLKEFRNADDLTLTYLLKLPFKDRYGK